jgi:hypothetical protein
MKRFAFLILSFGGLVSFLFPLLSLSARDTFELFPGPSTQPLTTDDLILHRMSDEFYAESWYLSTRFEDGTLLFLHYGVSNAGLGSFNGAVEHTLILPDGRVIFDKAQFPPDKIRYSKSTLDIRFGNEIQIRGDGTQYRLVSRIGKVTYDLTVTAEVPGLKFGEGKTRFPKSKQFYALAILTPRARVGGVLRMEGKEEPKMGLGYMDHAWQNYPAHKMADRLYSFRSFDPDQGVAFLTFFFPGGGEIPTFVAFRRGEIVFAEKAIRTTEEELSPQEEKPRYHLPRSIKIHSSSGVTAEIRFGRRLMRQDATEDFNLFERTLIKMFVADPVLYRFEGSYELYRGEEVWRGNGVIEAVVLRE